MLKISRRRQWQPTPVLLPEKSHGRSSLVGCSPWGRYESDTTERLHVHFSLSHIGEENGNTLQCSCLENPRMVEPGRLPSMGSHTIRHNWSNLAAEAAWWLSSKESAGQCRRHRFNPWVRKIACNPLQHSCPGNPRTEEPGRLPSTGSQGVGHDLVTKHQQYPWS